MSSFSYLNYDSFSLFQMLLFSVDVFDVCFFEGVFSNLKKKNILGFKTFTTKNDSNIFLENFYEMITVFLSDNGQ